MIQDEIVFLLILCICITIGSHIYVWLCTRLNTHIPNKSKSL